MDGHFSKFTGDDKPLKLGCEPKPDHVCKVLRQDALIFHHGRHAVKASTTKVFDVQWAQKNGFHLELVQTMTLHNAGLQDLLLASSARLQSLRKLTLRRVNPASKGKLRGHELQFHRKRDFFKYEKFDVFATCLSTLTEDFLPNWDHDLLIAWRQVEVVLESFPQLQRGKIKYYRNPWWSSKGLRVTHQRLLFVADINIGSKDDLSLHTIDSAVLGPNVDEGVAQMCDGRTYASYTVGTKENYQNLNTPWKWTLDGKIDNRPERGCCHESALSGRCLQ